MSILPVATTPISLKRLLPLLPRRFQDRVREMHYLSKLRAATVFIEDDLRVISLLVHPGDTVMDIGANFGLFTRFLSENAGPSGRVHSFEPTLAMSRVLNHIVKAFPLVNVTTSPLALSDRIGTAQIKVPVYSNRSPNYYEASLCIAPHTAVGEVDTIETTTLDAYCEARAVCGLTFIKCDVEGHEIAVLNGARRTLERFRPAILLEVNEPLHEAGHGADVRQLIESLDYGIHVFENGAIRPWRNDDTFVNYVLLPVQTETR